MPLASGGHGIARCHCRRMTLEAVIGTLVVERDIIEAHAFSIGRIHVISRVGAIVGSALK